MACVQTIGQFDGTETQESVGCKYCNGFLSERLSSDPWNQILYETENFVIVPTLGSLVEGWLLIVSKTHYVCMGALPNYLDSEFLFITKYAKEAVSAAYGSATVFEHGPSRKGLSVGCGIDHAHFHVVPLRFSLMELAKSCLELDQIGWNNAGLSELKKAFNTAQSYLYIDEPSRNSVYCKVDCIPCQFFRKLIATKLGMPEKHDYRKNCFAHNADQTAIRMIPFFNNLYGSRKR